jgi:hypothetical protein
LQLKARARARGGDGWLGGDGERRRNGRGKEAKGALVGLTKLRVKGCRPSGLSGARSEGRRTAFVQFPLSLTLVVWGSATTGKVETQKRNKKKSVTNDSIRLSFTTVFFQW